MPVGAPQKQAAEVVALILVAAVTAFFLMLTFVVLGNEPLGDRSPGLFFLLICADNGVAKILSGIPLLVAFGLSFIVPSIKADWRFYATIVMCVVGGICTAFLLYFTNDPDVAHRFWSYSEIAGTTTPETFSSGSKWALGGITVWYIGIVSTQLGMRQQ